MLQFRRVLIAKTRCALDVEEASHFCSAAKQAGEQFSPIQPQLAELRLSQLVGWHFADNGIVMRLPPGSTMISFANSLSPAVDVNNTGPESSLVAFVVLLPLFSR